METWTLPTNKGNVTNSRANSLISSCGISWSGILKCFTLSEWHKIPIVWDFSIIVCLVSHFVINLNLTWTWNWKLRMSINKVTHRYYSSCIAYKWILPTTQECDQLQSTFSLNSFCISGSIRPETFLSGTDSSWHCSNYVISLPLILCQAKIWLEFGPRNAPT